MNQYRIRNWGEFQHYKDRSPPWVRLHRSLLDNFDFHRLPVASKALAPMMWLLASEHSDHQSGLIHGSDEEITFRLRMTIKDFHAAIKPLIERKFIEMVRDASNPLSDGMQTALPETEAETYSGEAETDERQSARPTLESLSVDHIAEWLAKKRAEGRYIQHDENFILDYFKNYCQSHGKHYENYIAALRNAFTWKDCQPAAANKGGSKSKWTSAAEQIIAEDRAAGQGRG